MSRAMLIASSAIVLAVIVATGWYWWNRDSDRVQTGPLNVKGPLLEPGVTPPSERDVEWMLFRRLLWRPDDYPLASAQLLHILEGDATDLMPEPWEPQRDPWPVESWPFAVGLRSGNVLLADEVRVLRDDDLGPKLDRFLAPDVPHGQHPAARHVLVVASQDLLLRPAGWSVVEAYDPGSDTWQPTKSDHRLESHLESWPARIPAMYLVPTDGSSSIECTGYLTPSHAASGRERARRTGEGYLVRFGKPVPVTIVPLRWNPLYFAWVQREGERGRPTRKSVPALSPVIEPRVVNVQEALVLPTAFEDQCEVYLRSLGADDWLCGVAVSASTPTLDGM
ncbi:MAG: hypothetical protein HRF45_02410 [Fimbriimonadia bacterium]